MKRIAFATPVVPSFHGNGLAMRAAATLHLLAASGAHVHLIVNPIYTTGSEPETAVQDLCESWHIVVPPPCSDSIFEWYPGYTFTNLPAELRLCSFEWQERVADVVRSISPDVLMLFRFYLMPFFARANGRFNIWLDLDELESSARLRLADLCETVGKHDDARKHRADSIAYESLERHVFQRLDRIFVASQREAALVQMNHILCRPKILPNTYPRIRPQNSRVSDGVVRLLYVGSFGYFPNQDAMAYFCAEVLPLLRQRSVLPIELHVVGSNLPPLGEHPQLRGVYFVGPVGDVTSYYSNSDIVIVPLRAGGGTRIKILEAFSHQRAVVSTSLGAEGLEVDDRKHIHIAYSAEEFADRCLRLIKNPRERERIAHQAHSLFIEHYSLETLESRAMDFFG